ncbi:MAG: aspartate kinase [Gilvibacter sp.]
MRVFKFGGASVKDVESIRNVAKVLDHTGYNNLVVVISAMGKMTNQMERVVDAYCNDSGTLESELAAVYTFHYDIIEGLFPQKTHPIYGIFLGLLEDLKGFIKTNKSKERPFIYDQIVSFGELFSTHILSAYLTDAGYKNSWLDARRCIKTDDNYRDPRVDWNLTQANISKYVDPEQLTVTQGFLGSETSHNFTTTLGREGSDYTAAIFGYCLNAQDVTIWKDVPGVLNADPRHFEQTALLEQISYREAIELAFYGASVIHPKTLQPLQRKEIPLYVRSFLKPEGKGTCVGKGKTLEPMISCFILKKDQVLISLSSLDFSFMVEDHIGDVFKWLHRFKMKVELIQNSAISFSVCVDNKFNKLPELLIKLRENFLVEYHENVTLYTVRHSVPQEIAKLTKGQEVLLKQETQETVQIVINQA